MSDGSVARASVRPVANVQGGPLSFPVLAVQGPAVIAADHRSPGTRLHSALAAVAALVAGLVAVGILAVTTFGVGLVGLLIMPLLDRLLQRRVMATLRASCLEVGPRQLPELYLRNATLATRNG